MSKKVKRVFVCKLDKGKTFPMKVFIEMNQKSEGHFLNKLHVFFKDFYVHKSDVEKYWGWSVFIILKLDICERFYKICSKTYFVKSLTNVQF